MEVVYKTLFILVEFLIGSVMFSQWIPKRLTGKDVSEMSVDNNPGAFNAFKHCGVKIGFICLFLDVMKGFLPVFLASLFLPADNVVFSLAIVAPALGHAVGLFNRFRGGKCVATSFGILAGLIPVTWIPFAILAVSYILFSTVLKIRNGAVRSVAAYVTFMLVSAAVLGITGRLYTAVGCAALSLLPIVRFLFVKNGLADNKYHDGRQTSREENGEEEPQSETASTKI